MYNTFGVGELPKWLKGRAWKARRLREGRWSSNLQFSATIKCLDT